MFDKKISEKEAIYLGVQEILYLHSNYFKPNRDIINILNVVENEKYVIMRFVSWNAHHDVGQKGLNIATKESNKNFI